MQARKTPSTDTFYAVSCVAIDPFHATGLLPYLPENISKPETFWYFQELYKEKATYGMKWVVYGTCSKLAIGEISQIYDH